MQPEWVVHWGGLVAKRPPGAADTTVERLLDLESMSGSESNRRIDVDTRTEQARLNEPVRGDARATQVGAAELGAEQSGAGQIGVAEIGVAQIGVDEVGLTQT